MAGGTEPNGTDVFDWFSVGRDESVVVENLSLEEGVKYYISLEIINAVGMSTWGVTEGIVVSWNNTA